MDIEFRVVSEKPFRFKVQKGEVLSISGSVQAATPQGVVVTGPGGIRYEDNQKGMEGIKLKTFLQKIDVDGDVTVEFQQNVELLVAEADCKYKGKTLVRTYVLATDENYDPVPDRDFNDLVLNICVTHMAG